jgi:DNA-binding SARP family transcriptional activator
MPVDDSSQLHLQLINGFELSRGVTRVRVPVPAQRLLAYLGLQSRPVSRRAVAAALWDGSSDQQAAARLRSTLWRLPAPGDVALVVIDAGRLALAASVEVDVDVARDQGRVDELAIDALGGDVLTGWPDEWVLVERERFRQLRLHRLEELSALARERGDLHVAVQAALTAVAVDPLRESAHRQVMLAHLAEDNPSEALRQYGIARAVLRDELGIAPSSATRAVVADLLGRPLDLRTAS